MSQRWKKILRDVGVFIILVQVVEVWQSRCLPHGSFPTEVLANPLLETSKVAPIEIGRSRLVYAFAPWCGVCRMSAANLNRLTFTGVDVVAVALSYEGSKDVSEFVTSTGLAVPVLLADARSQEALGVNAFPTYFLVSSGGSIVKAWSGYTTTLGLMTKVILMPLWQVLAG